MFHKVHFLKKFFHKRFSCYFLNFLICLFSISNDVRVGLNKILLCFKKYELCFYHHFIISAIQKAGFIHTKQKKKGKLRKIKKISGFRHTENLCSVLATWHQSVFYHLYNIGYLCLVSFFSNISQSTFKILHVEETLFLLRFIPRYLPFYAISNCIFFLITFSNALLFY